MLPELGWEMIGMARMAASMERVMVDKKWLPMLRLWLDITTHGCWPKSDFEAQPHFVPWYCNSVAQHNLMPQPNFLAQ